MGITNSVHDNLSLAPAGSIDHPAIRLKQPVVDNGAVNEGTKNLLAV